MDDLSVVAALRLKMIALQQVGRLDEAAELARQLPSGELVWGPYAGLWWHHCEALGDHVKARDPELADRLYELALASHVKQGSMATGSGAGLASRQHQARLEGKREAL